MLILYNLCTTCFYQFFQLQTGSLIIIWRLSTYWTPFDSRGVVFNNAHIMASLQHNFLVHRLLLLLSPITNTYYSIFSINFVGKNRYIGTYTYFTSLTFVWRSLGSRFFIVIFLLYLSQLLFQIFICIGPSRHEKHNEKRNVTSIQQKLPNSQTENDTHQWRHSECVTDARDVVLFGFLFIHLRKKVKYNANIAKDE